MKPLVWHTQVTRGATVRHRDGRGLAVLITGAGDDLMVAALECPRGVTGVQGVMDQHAHTLIREHVKTVRTAIKLAENYAAAWLKARAAAAACDCAEIAPVKRAAKRASKRAA